MTNETASIITKVTLEKEIERDIRVHACGWEKKGQFTHCYISVDANDAEKPKNLQKSSVQHH